VPEHRHSSSRAYEQELVETVGSGTERWLTEIRLAIIGIIISVGLGAADIALSLSGWEVALAVGVISTLAFVALLWHLRPRASRGRTPADEDLRYVEAELGRIRDELEQEREPLRELLDSLAAAADALSAYMERIYEESYLATDSSGTLRRLRAYDGRLYELTAEIRCRKAKA
jgi:hypothetical protein